MVEIKNVALIGATGALGEPILKALIDSGEFNVTAVTRPSSKATFPASVKVVKPDYSSVESVTAAFKGQDAVISAVGTEGLAGQHVFVDAAVAAGVKRFLPSEFGSDLTVPKTAALPVFGYKVATQKKLDATVAANPDFTYTSVINGPFLDWGLNMSFLINLNDGKPKLYDGGNGVFSSTTLGGVGKAVVGVLSHFEETKNKHVYVREIDISQNQLLDLAKKIAPEKKWEPIAVDTAAIEKASNESLAKGEVTAPVMFGYLMRAIFSGEGYGAQMTKDDNELLGITRKTEADVEAMIRPLLAEAK